MIRGVNKHVIDIGETGNPYYERAILFLRPEYADIQREILEREAKKFLQGIGTTSSLKKYNKVLYWGIRLGGAAVIGAFLSLFALNCFYCLN
ncbi:MAG: hypothetical protein RUMPE_00139 [Eubacteriales bacterium SKADARSKE-1]|nr:hypothetical protein [Eubacteriales bacterium SKADARSKE-1]